MKFRITSFLSLLLILCVLNASADVIQLPIDDSAGTVPLEEGYIDEYNYVDDSVSVSITSDKVYDTKYYIADIKINSASQLRTISAGGFNKDRVIRGLVLSKRVHPVLAINGDFFSYIPDGYLIRNGKKYRDIPGGERDVLLIDIKGNFHIIQNATKESLQTYNESEIMHSFNFGPYLVQDGVMNNEIIDNNNGAFLCRQRCAIAQMGPLHYICVVSEGPMERSTGMTLPQFAEFMHSLGVEQAYNLDGGNSAYMIFNGKKINAVRNINTRDLADIIYFASAYTPSEE